MWPLKMTAGEAEIQWRWFRMSLFRHSGHFWPFGAFFGHFWPILAPNSKLSQASHVTTQNDRKRGRNPLKMVSDGNFNGFRSFQAILCHFGAKNGSNGLQNNTIFIRNDLDVLKVTSETISIRFLLVLWLFWGVTRPVCDNFVFQPKNGS